MRKLGKDARGMLNGLASYGYFGPQCGWRWRSPLTDRDILDSLYRRGLVQFHSSLRVKGKTLYHCYTITEAGKLALEAGRA